MTDTNIAGISKTRARTFFASSLLRFFASSLLRFFASSLLRFFADRWPALLVPNPPWTIPNQTREPVDVRTDGLYMFKAGFFRQSVSDAIASAGGCPDINSCCS